MPTGATAGQTSAPTRAGASRSPSASPRSGGRCARSRRRASTGRAHGSQVAILAACTDGEENYTLTIVDPDTGSLRQLKMPDPTLLTACLVLAPTHGAAGFEPEALTARPRELSLAAVAARPQENAISGHHRDHTASAFSDFCGFGERDG
jgi:hypothetical protein